jgi:hypothetical protein
MRAAVALVAASARISPDWPDAEDLVSNGEARRLAPGLTSETYFLDGMAVCMDGTPGVFTLLRGSEASSKNWYVHHQGGGLCTLGGEQFVAGGAIDDCRARRNTPLGSSSSDSAQGMQENFWPWVSGTKGYFSADPEANPFMHDWNKVYIRYCDGSTHSARNATPTVIDGEQFYFRGAYIVEAVIAKLQTLGMAEANNIVVGGCSAGGIGTFHHMDRWLDAFPHARTGALPDSGAIMPHLDWKWNDPQNGVLINRLLSMLDNMANNVFNASGGLNSACVADMQKQKMNVARCYDAAMVWPYLRTPTFVIQSIYDVVLGPVQSVVSGDTERFIHMAAVQKQQFTEMLMRPPHGGFIHSCPSHCGAMDGTVWTKGTAAGEVMNKAFTRWITEECGMWEQADPVAEDQAMCSGGAGGEYKCNKATVVV